MVLVEEDGENPFGGYGLQTVLNRGGFDSVTAATTADEDAAL